MVNYDLSKVKRLEYPIARARFQRGGNPYLVLYFAKAVKQPDKLLEDTLDALGLKELGFEQKRRTEVKPPYVHTILAAYGPVEKKPYEIMMMYRKPDMLTITAPRHTSEPLFEEFIRRNQLDRWINL